MAVKFGDKISHVSEVIDIYTHCWLDGMDEEYAVVWDMQEHTEKSITVGYYGIDGSNLAGGSAKIDASVDVVRDMRRTFKREAVNAFVKSVLDYKQEIRKGSHAVVVRGRKAPKGTKLDVFWVGDRETYQSRYTS